jgi:hypothetical protein
LGNDRDAPEWDIVTLVAWWNLYALPALLMVAAIAILVRRRAGERPNFSEDFGRSIRRIGLIHCVLALHSLISLVQEVLTIRTMGIPGSHVGLVGSTISTLVNPALALGLLRWHQAARRLAIGWYVFLSMIAVIVVHWMYRYGVDVDPATWPVQLASKVMPFFLLSIMLLPRTKRLFAKGARSKHLSQPGDGEGSLPLAPARAGWPVVSVLTLLFLLVVCSNLVVDMADWVYRLTFEAEAVP